MEKYYLIKARKPNEGLYMTQYLDSQGEAALIIEKKENIVEFTEKEFIDLMYTACDDLKILKKLRKVIYNEKE